MPALPLATLLSIRSPIPNDPNPPFGATHPSTARDQNHNVIDSDITTVDYSQANPPFGATHPYTARDQHHDLVSGSSGPAIPVGAIVAIVVCGVLVLAVVGWIVYSHLRARRLGLPPPTLRSLIPNRRTQASSSAFEPTRPADSGSNFFTKLIPGKNRGYDGRKERMERLRRGEGDAWDIDAGERELRGGGYVGSGVETEYVSPSAGRGGEGVGMGEVRVHGGRMDGSGDEGRQGEKWVPPVRKSVESERQSVFREQM